MLQINMADVMNVVGSLVPYLVVIGVLLVLAIPATRCAAAPTAPSPTARPVPTTWPPNTR